MTSSRILLGLVFVGGGFALAGACSGASGDGGGGKGGGAAAAGGTGGDDGAAAAAGNGANEDGSGAAGSGGDDGPVFEVNLEATKESLCADTVGKAEKTPVDLYFMLDQSGSMTTANKWTAVTSAFKQFVESPQTVGLGVGIQYYPLPLECDITAYANPEVPIATLPGNAAAFKASLAAHSPTGGTPTKPALQGAINYAKGFALNNPLHKVFVVLATDGDPNSCSSTPAAVSAIAGAAATGIPKIQVFVIGMLTPNDPNAVNTVNLNEWADMGDDGQKNASGKAFLVDASVPQQFIDALLKIQGQALACEYKIPTIDGAPIDLKKVNVEYQPPGTPPPPKVQLVNVADASQCEPGKSQWYYDANPPTKIIICKDYCDALQKDNGGQVNIAFGCTDTIRK